VAFRDAARRADAARPVSRALAAVEITVNATLAQPDRPICGRRGE